MATGTIKHENVLKTAGDARNLAQDFNDFPNGHVYWANNSGGTSFSHAPGASAYHVFTILPIPTHGVQVAIKFTGSGLSIRAKVENQWGDWYELTGFQNSGGGT